MALQHAGDGNNVGNNMPNSNFPLIHASSTPNFENNFMNSNNNKVNNTRENMDNNFDNNKQKNNFHNTNAIVDNNHMMLSANVHSAQDIARLNYMHLDPSQLQPNINTNNILPSKDFDNMNNNKSNQIPTVYRNNNIINNYPVPENNMNQHLHSNNIPFALNNGPDSLQKNVPGSPIKQRANQNNSNFYQLDTSYIKRVNRACDVCRKKKIRCGLLNPSTNKCMNCTKKGLDCTFMFHYELEKKKDLKRKNKKIIETKKTTKMKKTTANNEKNDEVSKDQDTLSDEGLNKKDELVNNNISSGTRESSNELSQNEDIIVNEAENEHENKNLTNCSTALPEILENMNHKSLTLTSKHTDNYVKIPKDVFAGLEKILRKVDTLNKIESNTRQAFDKSDVGKKLLHMDDQFLPKCHPKLYKTHILTNYCFLWVNERIVPKPIENPKHYEPILKNVCNVLKWYLIQYKKMINYLEFLDTDEDGKYILYYYPQKKEECIRIMENLHLSMMYTTTCIISEKITTNLINKVYNNEPMIFEEKLLFNVCLIAGIQETLLISSEDDHLLRKDRYLPNVRELKRLESKLFTVVTYYYNKIIITAAGINIIRSLLLWARYCQFSLGADVTSVIFTKAVSVAYHIGLQKNEYYLKFSLEEALLRKGMWKYLLLLDRALAIRLSKPPLINKGIQSSEVYCDKGFFRDVKRIADSKAYEGSVIEINTFQDALNFTASNVKYIVVAMSQYGGGLIALETRILEICFTDLHIDKIPFEDYIETCTSISNQLVEWREKLHPIMKLETFKEYYKLLSQQETRGNPALQYEVICSRILMYQFRHLSLTIKLCLFIISVIDDNIDIVNASKRKSYFLDLKKDMVTRYLDSSRKILKTFTSVKYQPFFYREVMHYFSTAVITLILHLVDHINDKGYDLENAYILELLQTTYAHINNGECDRPIVTYLKWNTALIILSSFLSEIIQYYHGKNAYTGLYSYKIKIFEENTRQYLKVSTETCEEAIAELETVLKNKKLRKENNDYLLSDLNDDFLELIKTENLHVTFFEKLMKHSIQSPDLNTSLYSIQNTDRKYPNTPDNNIFTFLNSGTNFYDRDFNFLSLFEETKLL